MTLGMKEFYPRPCIGEAWFKKLFSPLALSAPGFREGQFYLHDLSGPAQSENVGPSCLKIIKKFKTATAEQQTRYRVLLGVGTCVCRGPTCEASPGHLSSSVTLQAVFQRLREAPTASLPVQAWVSQEQRPQPRIRLWGQHPSNATLCPTLKAG